MHHGSRHGGAAPGIVHSSYMFTTTDLHSGVQRRPRQSASFLLEGKTVSTSHAVAVATRRLAGTHHAVSPPNHARRGPPLELGLEGQWFGNEGAS